MSSLTVNVNDQSYTGHQIRPTVKDSNNNTQITAKLGTVNIDLGQFTISYPDSKDANKEVGTGTLTLAPKASNKNFTGSKEVSFKIVGQKIIWSNDVANAFKVYDMYSREPTTHTAMLGNVTKMARRYSVTGPTHIHSLYLQSHRMHRLSQMLKLTELQSK